MSLRDARGLDISAAGGDAVARYDAAIASYLAFRADTGARLKEALAADGAFPMALITRGYFFKLFATTKLDGRARASLAAAEAAVDTHGATTRERGHMAGLKAWCMGDTAGATDIWQAILHDHPRDVLALRMALHALFYGGDATAMRDTVGGILPAWSKHTPGYGHVLADHAFALEETGAYTAAEAAGRSAIELDAADPWAAHAVAHVMEMQGRARDGIAWIDGLADNWAGCHNFVGHLWWHRALFHLALGDNDAALALYDATVRGGDSTEYLDLCNAASLLWRLEEEGAQVGDRWHELAEVAAGRGGDHVLAFIDAHLLMALAATGRGGDRDVFLDAMGVAASAAATQAPVYREVAIPIGRALAATRTGDHGAAVDLLLPVRGELWRLGGSHAQRDVFTRTLIASALAAGRFSLARDLLAERLAARPNDRWGWQRAARAHDGLRDDDAAADARQRVAALLA